jgi:hypothetical protein
MLDRQVRADPAFAEGTLDVAARGNGQVYPPHPLVSLLIETGVALHQDLTGFQGVHVELDST